MGALTPIEWTDATWNVVGGCSVHSPGCTNCYAMKLAGTRLKHHPLYAGTTNPSAAGPVFNGHMTKLAEDAKAWNWPIGWRGSPTPVMGKGAASLIFVGDMADLFHVGRPLVDIGEVFAVIGHAEFVGRDHIFQLLTKRADLMKFCYWNVAKKAWQGKRSERHHINNIWWGFSAERQEEFDKRWPHMRDIADDQQPVFVSYEPAIGPLVLPPDFLALGKRAQVIAGGESGRGARPSKWKWFTDVRDQCAAAGVPFFFKQWGEWAPALTGMFYSQTMVGPQFTTRAFGKDCIDLGDGYGAVWLGKKVTGRLLDGVEHNGFITT